MEISEVRKRLLVTIDRAKRAAAERRDRLDEASHEYEVFLERVAVPVFRMVANSLRPEGYLFTIFTPGGSVRLMSDRSTDDYIELALDTSGPRPRVVGRTSRARGRHGIESEHPIGGAGPIRDVTEEDVLEFVLRELEPFVDR
jgi:hypothetical protein